jgi:hypothetical protein
MASERRRYWRVFPWEPAARAGAPFSPGFVPAAQGAGRFDRRAGRVLYLAGSAEHAAAEKLQRFRDSEIDAADLTEFGRPLVLVEVDPGEDPIPAVADLCDPDTLAEYAIGPDRIAAHSTTTTQAVADVIARAGHDGLRWWSVFRGEWHTLVVFLAEAADPRWFGRPVPLRLDHPAVRAAATALGIRNPAA